MKGGKGLNSVWKNKQGAVSATQTPSSSLLCTRVDSVDMKLVGILSSLIALHWFFLKLYWFSGGEGRLALFIGGGGASLILRSLQTPKTLLSRSS